ncbi:MAG: tRNA guanosine(34) transglycosylase Tgt [Akkermansia sp.]|nr:tRNA guanosine(34) transglycosylase Tgt [Akkermansia sp.]
MSFSLLQTDPSGARRGVLHLPHGDVQTPAFMPVGTQGTVKTLHPEELRELGAEIILGNTYHLSLRPGAEQIASLGGLHALTGWDGPMLTDSGGFQVWSLARLRKITEEGVRFQNHIDGAHMLLTPEKSMEIQALLGSDIAMLFDECPPYPCGRDYAEKSLGLTLRWAERCRGWADAHKPASGACAQSRFGIVQGSAYADLRKKCALELRAMDFDGYAVGGVSVGEPESEMLRAIDNSVPWLPEDKPRYAMGLGTPVQMLEMIERGIDMFDCVMPTRLARHGIALTPDGPVHIRNKKWELDTRPLDPASPPHVSRFPRAAVRHFFRAGEVLALRLLSFQNLSFYLRLMAQARSAIESGEFGAFKGAFISQYQANNIS